MTLEEMIQAAAKAILYKPETDYHEADETPDDAKAFPGIKIGDRLYWYCESEGLYESIVVAVMPGDFVRVAGVQLDTYKYWKGVIGWGRDYMFRTRAGALDWDGEDSWASDLDYYQRMVAKLQAIRREAEEDNRKGIAQPEQPKPA